MGDWVSIGTVCSGRWKKARGEVEVDLEMLKNTTAVGIGGRWRYAEGSRSKIRREGLARMRARRLKGVELGTAVLVSGRCVKF